MKRSLFVLLAALAVLPASAQSVFGIAQKWSQQDYKAATVDAEGVARAFAANFPENSLLKPLVACLDGESPAGNRFTHEAQFGYVELTLGTPYRASVQVKVWKHPGGIVRAAVKMVNDQEDTLPRIYFFSVAADGTMTPMEEPEGLVYNCTDFILPVPDDLAIEVPMEDADSDWILPRDNGTFEYRVSIHAPKVSLVCYIDDSDPYTNIRKSPGGALLGKVDNGEEDAWTVTIHNPSKGWWQLYGKRLGDIDISEGAWIHYSVLGMRTRNYGGGALSLRASASTKASVVATINKEEMTVRPMDISADGEWTKVKCEAGTGWIETSWLCGNPYTTCP